ncbi:aminoglycoside phosphotransferase family protein [Glaciihabitans arcticus]|uniref:Aminoglycoside phosphotransferase family protein n=1 Tax=Glaciihabitans arcticus TaxID=2668039 RepID=A0A4Q9GST0_9MICO|nr:phosphotransferase [Glaciihabitans arcticus]TBN57665.1 aminoglycoside phosphotransferase family protein [Glaciihabitans arcticus]
MSDFPLPSALPDTPLIGGNSTPVTRRGDTVLRGSGPWTPTIHRLLEHVRDRGIDWVPEPRGSEGEQEILGFLPGDVPNYPLPEHVWSEQTLDTSAWMLRNFHDATVDFDRTDAVWRQPSHEPAEVICHNDFAPYNFAFEGERMTGVIDWDMASPGARAWDLAYLAYRLVPLSSEPGGPRAEADARLDRLLEQYGAEFDREHLLAQVVLRLEDLAAWTLAHPEHNADAAAHAELYLRDAGLIRQTLPR